jgi:uncharacterized radical SAM superfamily Fe-S cluster-containing enzyme
VRIYLQFDGLEEATHLALRGRDLRAAKTAALERCADAGLLVMLVAAVEAGVNEHELGAVVRYGIEHPAVHGVTFQPVTHAGRTPTFDPREHLTNAEVIHGLVDRWTSARTTKKPPSDSPVTCQRRAPPSRGSSARLTPARCSRPRSARSQQPTHRTSASATSSP